VGGVKGVDLEGWKAIVAECHTAFSDFDVAILTQVAEGDLVATRWQFEGTQRGEYLGRPPSGRRATWTGIQIDRFADGKIVESWVDWDKYRLFETLGFLD
jgi:predicted ester cyclase